MKLIFMGTPDFSVGTLEALIAAGSRPAMRSPWWSPSRISQRAGAMSWLPRR